MGRIFLFALGMAAIVTAAPVADPAQPHLAQAWTAQSEGDGLPGQVGFESYLYEDKHTQNAIQAHMWDYGETCKKLEFWTNEKGALQGTFYLKCDGGVDCCFSGVDGHAGGNPARPDVKGWDISKSGWGKKVEYTGNHHIKDLYNEVDAETWFEKDHIPFTNVGVNYTYYVTRNGTDVITHKISYAAPTVSPGDILYGNFTVQHDIAAFKQKFVIPSQCYPQGSHKGHALNCNGEKVKEWERKHFKHSAASKGWM